MAHNFCGNYKGSLLYNYVCFIDNGFTDCCVLSANHPVKAAMLFANDHMYIAYMDEPSVTVTVKVMDEELELYKIQLRRDMVEGSFYPV
jgi:hypothetical protein